MASSDVVLASKAVAAAPKDYLVPNAQELTLLSVSALLDGTDAAGSYLAVLEIISPGGDTMASLPVSASAAAGSEVFVTWAPFLRAAAAASGGGATLTEWDTAGTYTYHVPSTAGLLVIDVVGGGGGGAGFGNTGSGQIAGRGGGGGGAWQRVTIPADYLPAALTVVVGSGGLGGYQPGNSSYPGMDGGSSAVELANGAGLVMAHYGYGGTAPTGGGGGAGYAAGGAYADATGTAGGDGVSGAAGNVGGQATCDPGGAATGGGAGGGTTGTTGVAFAGGAGGRFMASDGSTVLVAGAAGGTAGSSGVAGGAGAAGASVLGRDIGGAGGGGGGGCNSGIFESGRGGDGYRGGGGGGAGASNITQTVFRTVGGNGGDGFVRILAI